MRIILPSLLRKTGAVCSSNDAAANSTGLEDSQATLPLNVQSKQWSSVTFSNKLAAFYLSTLTVSILLPRSRVKTWHVSTQHEMVLCTLCEIHHSSHRVQKHDHTSPMLFQHKRRVGCDSSSADLSKQWWSLTWGGPGQGDKKWPPP